MTAPSLASYAVVTALLSFVLSVGAASLAINLYSLLRTGKMGASWRVLIIASVLFALQQAVKLIEVADVPYARLMNLSSIIELIFILALAYAFFLQRQVFTESQSNERDNAEDDETEEEEAVLSVRERDL